MCGVCAGLRACRSNSRGAFATCSRIEVGVEPDAVLVLDDLPGAAQQLDRLGQQELDPELGDDPPPAAVEHRHRVLAEDLVARHRVDEQAGLLRCVGLTSRAAVRNHTVRGTRVPSFCDDGRASLPRNAGGRPRRRAARPRARERAAGRARRARQRRRDPQEHRLAAASARSSAAAWSSRTAAAGACGPGPAILRVAERGMLERNIVELARPSLDALAAGERRDDQPRRARRRRRRAPRARSTASTSSGPGSGSAARVDYHCTAVGKVFLAFGARASPTEPLARHAPSTITDPDAAPSRARRPCAGPSYATAIDELEPGLAAMAAPVRGARGDVIAALQHLRPDAADDARADPRAATGPDRRGARAQPPPRLREPQGEHAA